MTKKNRSESLEGKIETVQLEPLRIDEVYQRPLKGHHKFIAANFNPVAAGVLTVARRSDASLWVLDGRQRREAMLKQGITKWKAQVIESSGQAFEAALFGLLNDKQGKKGLSAKDMFRARLAAKDDLALAIKDAVESLGLKLHLSDHGGSQGVWPHFGATAMAYRYAKTYGSATFKSALELCVTTWPQIDEAVNEAIVGGTVLLVAQRGDVLDRRRFQTVLGKVPPRTVLLNTTNAMQGGTRHHFTADCMMGYYNSRLRTGVLKLFAVERNERLSGGQGRPDAGKGTEAV